MGDLEEPSLLRHLEAAGFEGAPRALGHDQHGREVVCHGDLGPHTTVFRGDAAVAIIDWDGDIGPGTRGADFAHAVWCFADLTESAVPVEEQARMTALMCDAYPGMTPGLVVRELDARFRRARTQHAHAGRAAAVAVFDRLLAWLDAHGDRIAAASTRVGGQPWGGSAVPPPAGISGSTPTTRPSLSVT